MPLKKENWKEEHLGKLHKTNFPWCPLCVAKDIGEKDPQKHLVPPQQDPSQTGMDYLKPDYKPDSNKYYGDVVDTGSFNKSIITTSSIN